LSRFFSRFRTSNHQRRPAMCSPATGQENAPGCGSSGHRPALDRNSVAEGSLMNTL
jgi:hypothetical protein